MVRGGHGDYFGRAAGIWGLLHCAHAGQAEPADRQVSFPCGGTEQEHGRQTGGRGLPDPGGSGRCDRPAAGNGCGDPAGNTGGNQRSERLYPYGLCGYAGHGLYRGYQRKAIRRGGSPRPAVYPKSVGRRGLCVRCAGGPAGRRMGKLLWCAHPPGGAGGGRLVRGKQHIRLVRQYERLPERQQRLRLYHNRRRGAGDARRSPGCRPGNAEYLRAVVCRRCGRAATEAGSAQGRDRLLFL